MSDSQAYKEVTVASDGVTVTKRFEADEFPVPAIAFNVRSRRSEPVTLRLVDTVPEDVAVEDLGFHPEYGSEYWDINDDRIAFEKEIEPDADYTTVYGIRATGTDDVEKFLTEPEIETVDPPLDDDADIVGSGDDAVKDVIAGDSDSVPGLEDDADDDIETLDLKDPNSPGGEGGDTADDAEQVDVETGNVIAAMANEIRQNNVSAEDVKLLKRALDAVSEDDDDDAGGVNEARIKRIQSDISDLRAYTDALEEFLEENGTGDEMIEDFSERLDAFETELATFEDDIRSAKSAAETATEEVQVVEETVDSMDEELDEMESHLGDLEAEIDDVREELGDGEIDERLSDLEGEIEDLKEWREQLSSVIGGGN
ncbi:MULTISPECIES: hypothetical protein [Haloarcula]|uniref:Uncharacterized protein n=1 Tax=Haloarcula pellucida TaxID=1427151 RepID=A0A830GI45_9EURY|nr:MULTISPECIES: hypothetical protein [Halomicroarcula]MBX0347328.1 hypothetical protein [Halomicroarcula pellucida]MDS0276797.1 hypothetical protein [Halomicroarcula sp. S1AR25-4]GGN88111.1 hypothetical protein GCM10009030_07500 [Halomicroarcula pellucida]